MVSISYLDLSNQKGTFIEQDGRTIIFRTHFCLHIYINIYLSPQKQNVQIFISISGICAESKLTLQLKAQRNLCREIFFI